MEEFPVLLVTVWWRLAFRRHSLSAVTQLMDDV